MPNIKTKKISEFSFVISYAEMDDIRYKVKEAEQAFKNLFQNQAVVNNIPDDTDPRIPRIVFSKKDKNAGLSKVAARLDGTFSTNLGIKESSEIIKKNCLGFYDAVLKMIGDNKLRDLGLIISLSYVSDDSKNDVMSYFKKRFLSVEIPGDIVSFQLQVGSDLGDGYYLHYTPSHYEIRTKKYDTPINVAGNKLKIDINSLTLIESGYELKIDINNKPAFKNNSNFDRSPSALIEKMMLQIRGDADKFVGLYD